MALLPLLAQREMSITEDVELAALEAPAGLNDVVASLVRDRFPDAEVRVESWPTGFGVGDTLFAYDWEIPWEVEDARRIDLPAEAGVFVLLDLRSHLTEPTWEAEHALWITILEQASVNLTPGAACRVGEPGFFRLCYAAQPPETVEVAVRRIVKILS